MEKQYTFIGNASKSGISTYLFKDGKLQFSSSTQDFERCTYLAQDKNYIYAVQEIGDENKCGYVISYKKTSKGLMYINKKSSAGSNPCHIEISPKNRMLFVSNYRDGYFSTYKINFDGSIGKLIHNEVIDSKKSHLHCAKVFNNEHNVITVDLGMDILTVYEIYSNKLLKISSNKLEDGTEPRHIAIYNNNIFLVSEKSCELYLLNFCNQKINILQKASILPINHIKKPNDTGAAIKVSNDGKYIYTTLRGHNSISVFKYENNKIELLQNILSYGNTPRDLEIDKTQKYLLVANQDSDEISIYSRDVNTGKLKFINKQNTSLPTCILSE